MIRTFVALAALAAAVPAQAALVNLNTGTAAWQVQQVSGPVNLGALGTTTAAQVLTGTLPFAANLPGFEAFAWVNPFGGAVWIGQRNTDGQFSNGGSITCGSPCGATAGIYQYSLSFDASLGGSMNLSGFTADNRVVSLFVNQANVGQLYGCTQGGAIACAATQNSITPGTGTLSLLATAGGIVTITALVENLDGPGRNPSGFILAGSALLNDPGTGGVPEPASWAMLLGGFGLTGLALRRRRALA